jgi:hypothetical protein
MNKTLDYLYNTHKCIRPYCNIEEDIHCTENIVALREQENLDYIMNSVGRLHYTENKLNIVDWRVEADLNEELFLKNLNFPTMFVFNKEIVKDKNYKIIGILVWVKYNGT